MNYLVAATKAEAAPLVSALKLTKTAGAFDCFWNEDTALVISGIGKCRSAAACAWLQSRPLNTHTPQHASKNSLNRGRHTDCWINFGIAGHKDAAIGSVHEAHKITDHGSNHVWYPPRISSQLPSANLTTFDKPISAYLGDQLHDMEASGFIDTARMFAHAELVQAVKIVSDNEQSPLSDVDAKKATELIADNISAILGLLERLKSQSSEIYQIENTIYDEITTQWRFSVSQKVQLERQLERYNTLHDPLMEIPTDLLKVKSSKDVIGWLTLASDNADLQL